METAPTNTEAEAGQARADRQAANLLDHGYTEVREHGRLAIGDRVRHVGEQYPEAHTGTATIERIFVRGERDVELIARRDKPGFGGPTSTHGFWANYHTVKISSALPSPSALGADRQDQR